MRVSRHRPGVGWFLLEARHPVVAVHFQDPKLAGGLGTLHRNRPNRQVRAALDVVLDERLVVHLVDMVAGRKTSSVAENKVMCRCKLAALY